MRHRREPYLRYNARRLVATITYPLLQAFAELLLLLRVHLLQLMRLIVHIPLPQLPFVNVRVQGFEKLGCTLSVRSLSPAWAYITGHPVTRRLEGCMECPPNTECRGQLRLPRLQSHRGVRRGVSLRGVVLPLDFDEEPSRGVCPPGSIQAIPYRCSKTAA